MTKYLIGVLGASSMVGGVLLSYLKESDKDVIAFSRNSLKNNLSGLESKITWHQLEQAVKDVSQIRSQTPKQQLSRDWVSLMPIWVLPGYFDWLSMMGVKRIVALSSTSRFTKENSKEDGDLTVVSKLIDGEEKLIQWATEHGIEWVILRPTLIYGGGKDKNISAIARFIQRFGFFPILGKGQGLRQPVHVVDVGMACYQALIQSSVSNQAYNISGQEKLTYRDMLARIFMALGIKPRIVSLPLPLLKIGLMVMKIIPKYRGFTFAMFSRMNQDMVFDHDAATRDFGFSPQPFELKGNDL